MTAYVVRRIIWAIFVVLIVTLLTYVIFYVMPPGDPALRFAGKSPTPETIAAGAGALRADGPWYEQYGLFLKRLVTGDEWGWPGLGFSYDTRVSGARRAAYRMPRTIFLAVGAALVWAIMGVAIGVISAIKRGTHPRPRRDGLRALRRLGAGVLARPLRALGLLAEAPHPPGHGLRAVLPEPEGVVHPSDPALARLALLYAAFYARITRGNLLETMGEDYIRTARAKGLSERKVIMQARPACRA